MRKPDAVAGLVVPVIVAAVKVMVGRRAFAHVIEKVLERTPAFAHCDPTASVTMKPGALRVAATLTHRHPNVVKRCSLFPVLAAERVPAHK